MSNVLTKLANIMPKEAETTQRLLNGARENESLSYGYAAIWVGTPLDTLYLMGQTALRLSPFSKLQGEDLDKGLIGRTIAHVTWSITTAFQVIRTIAFAILFGTPYLIFSTFQLFIKGGKNVSLLKTSIEGHSSWARSPAIQRVESNLEVKSTALTKAEKRIQDLEGQIAGLPTRATLEKLQAEKKEVEIATASLEQEKLNLQAQIDAAGEFTIPKVPGNASDKTVAFLLQLCNGYWEAYTTDDNTKKDFFNACVAIFGEDATPQTIEDNKKALDAYTIPDKIDEGLFSIVQKSLAQQITDKAIAATLAEDLKKAQETISSLEKKLAAEKQKTTNLEISTDAAHLRVQELEGRLAAEKKKATDSETSTDAALLRVQELEGRLAAEKKKATDSETSTDADSSRAQEFKVESTDEPEKAADFETSTDADSSRVEGVKAEPTDEPGKAADFETSTDADSSRAEGFKAEPTDGQKKAADRKKRTFSFRKRKQTT